ncbi:MAG: TIGR03792 family protein [Actinomycetota bacterium]
MSFDFVSGERRPVEVLVFEMDPAVVDEFLRVDHEVWTLGEATLEGHDRIPFLSKDVWLDDAKPGLGTLSFVWESLAQWVPRAFRVFGVAWALPGPKVISCVSACG